MGGALDRGSGGLTTGEIKTSPYRLTLNDNIIISSIHRFLFPAISVLNYKTPPTSGCGATSAVQSAVV